MTKLFDIPEGTDVIELRKRINKLLSQTLDRWVPRHQSYPDEPCGNTCFNVEKVRL